VRWKRLRKQGTHGVGGGARAARGQFHKNVEIKDLNVGALSSEYRIIGEFKNLFNS
jgi:hypothetical protein